MILPIAWYGIQLGKEIKGFYKWCKKRADANKTPTPNGTTEKEVAASNSDIKIRDITVKNSPGCSINVGHQFYKKDKTD